MNTAHLPFTVLFTALLALLLTPALHATNYSEPPDFSNTSSGAGNYPVTSGANIFSGTVTTPNDGQDNFKVVVPAGLQILSVTENITVVSGSSFSGGATFNTQYLDGTGAQTFPIGIVPLPAGTYPAFINANFSVGNPWTMTVTTGAVPDYSIIVQNGVMTVTENSSNADALAISEPSNGTIAFAASGRTFRVNTGALNTGNSGSVPLSGVTSIQIVTSAGSDTISVGAFANSSFPSLSINDGTGTVTFNGNITFAVNNSLSVTDASGTSSGAATVNVTGALLNAGTNDSTGSITILCSRNVSLSSGAVLQTLEGNIDVEANQQTPATTGNFTGVNLDGSGTKIQSTDQGSVTVKGTGGNDGGGSQLGVYVVNGAKINGGGLGPVYVTGVGGASTNWINRGVTVYGQGSAITSGSSFVTVTGTGGPAGSAYGIGVSVLYGGVISGGGGVTVTGAGAGAPGSSSNHGVEIAQVGTSSNGSLITAPSYVNITGTAGPGAGFGLDVYDSGAITSTVNDASLNISADTLSFDSTATISTTGASSEVQISPNAPATQLDLGGAGGLTNALAITNAEIARFFTTQIEFSTNSGDITISEPITPLAGTNVNLAPSGAIHAKASGTDISLGTGTLTLGNTAAGTKFACPITGPDADTGYPQLNVAGGVNLNGAALDLTSTTLAGTLGQTFTIVANDGTDAITGTFANLPEGASLPWPGPSSTAFNARISYKGGDGNDVTLTLVPALLVTTTTDSVGGSLRNVIAYAASHAGADTIIFDSSLNGQTLTPTGNANGWAITISDSSPVTIDASSLSNGLTISGGGASGNYGLFTVNASSALTLRGVTLANGGGSSFAAIGGAIANSGMTTLINCTLSGNICNYLGLGGGAIANFAGTTTLFQCTLSGNSNQNASGAGGAIGVLGGTLNLTQSTVSRNSLSVSNGGGIIRSGGTLTITNSIVAGNTPNDINGTYSQAGVNVIGGTPLLATLGSYGGPTQTMPPLIGSPAIDTGSNASIPNDPATSAPFANDQRGVTRIQNGTVDIGAVETKAILVTTAADDGSAGSLREQVNQATDITNTITFDSTLAGSTIPLSNIGFGISISANTAIDASALTGGITISGGGVTRLFFTAGGETIVLTNLTLTGGNGAGAAPSGSGGAIYNNGANLTLNQCTLANNATTGTNGVGGAICHSTGTLTLNRCTLANNTASASGSTAGGIGIAAGSVALTQCTLSGNSAASSGGALKCNSGASLTLTQCTVAGNTAGTSGGGINNQGTNNITSSIVATNTAPTGGPDINNTGTVTASHCLIGNSANSTIANGVNGNITDTNALLAPLGSYGGPTQTMALLLGSPARNHAAVHSPAFISDQRGFAITDGLPDIGAYEAGDITNFNAWIYENLPASTATNAAQHGGTFDYDGDGVDNYNEWLAQTSPANPASVLRITQSEFSAETLSVTFPSVTGRHYTFESSTNLTTWTTLGSPISGTGSPIEQSFLFGSVPPEYFLRIRVGP